MWHRYFVLIAGKQLKLSIGNSRFNFHTNAIKNDIHGNFLTYEQSTYEELGHLRTLVTNEEFKPLNVITHYGIYIHEKKNFCQDYAAGFPCGFQGRNSGDSHGFYS